MSANIDNNTDTPYSYLHCFVISVTFKTSLGNERRRGSFLLCKSCVSFLRHYLLLGEEFSLFCEMLWISHHVYSQKICEQIPAAFEKGYFEDFLYFTVLSFKVVSTSYFHALLAITHRANNISLLIYNMFYSTNKVLTWA